MTKEEIQKGIDSMGIYVPISVIEKELGMPKTTIQKVLKEERKLPKKWDKPLRNYFIKHTEKKYENELKKIIDTPEFKKERNDKFNHLIITGLDLEKSIANIDNSEIEKQIAEIKEEKIPAERNTPFGKKIWLAEQEKRIVELKNKLK